MGGPRPRREEGPLLCEKRCRTKQGEKEDRDQKAAHGFIPAGEPSELKSSPPAALY
jgi:hypothetical protein